MSQLKKGALLSYLNVIITTIIGMLLTPFIIASIGDAEYGLYSLLGSLVAYFTLVDFGLGDTVIRFVARYRAKNQFEEQSKFLGTIVKLYSFITLILVILGILMYFNIEVLFNKSMNHIEINKAKIMFVLLLVNLTISLPGNIFLGVANAYERFIYARGVLVVKYLLRAIIVFVILSSYGDAVTLVIIDTSVNILFFISNFIFVKQYLKIDFVFTKLKIFQVKNILSFSVWMFLLGLISQFQWQGGQIVVGIRGGTEQVAIYAIGIMLGTYYGAFSSSISSLFLPTATKMVVNSENSDELTNMFIKIGRISFIVLFLILGGFYLLGKNFILLWLGETYIPAYYISLIIMLAYTIPLTQTFATSLLEVKNKIYYKTLIYLVVIPLGTILGYVSYPNFQLNGVIASICVLWFIGIITLNYIFHAVLGLGMVKFYFNFLKAILPLFFIIIILDYIYSSIAYSNNLADFVIKSLSYVIIYFIVYYVVVFNKYEKALIISLRR
ncbi:oligosaccharide flippase family protein [Aequorivita sp. SDUM287046]|uniref:Oligosaccharide flippase family protein n=1 Tax=Aequorivita aurantiaca TaxID=3053356 RepID=A0ABT8DL52_9FLAO|nr:oligosaccharide flippase family protein [Aequorivita aurantiaca]MDN3723968.1 oligosaccharide flippase family protein [Aequorivita aurantiaca]